MNYERWAPNRRRAAILNAAVGVAKKHGLANVTRDRVAVAADVSPPLVTKYFKNMGALRRAIMRAAVHSEILEIIAQGLAMKNPIARKAPAALRAEAAKTLTK